ncbi:cation:proton antiporter [Streptomyces sp. NPDC006208]|uniref:cation:proton antiporter n=1 Tax=Streptomyces sp. NPDC006208 TaxID=3156734 RepID=UPI0033B15DF5
MTDDEILLGIALTLVLATGSQILANKLRVPALILLLPVGFAAGALTDIIHPERLVPDFAALVSLSVAVILYDAGLGLDLRNLTGRTRWIVSRLLVFGVVLTFFAVSAVGPALFSMPLRVASMLAVILVVSGPTVVGPLLEYVRPTEKVRHILIWEGTLTDPIGGILGALVFHAIASTHRVDIGRGYQFGQFLISMSVGLVGGAVGTALLWLTLRTLRLGETLGTLAQLTTVIAVSAGCDIVRDDTGLIAAIVTGLAVTNIRGFDMPARRPFFGTVVQLIIGLLFVSISSTVTPASVVPVLVPALILIAILVLVVRPLVAFAATWNAELTLGERAFIGWMAPRGIVAASTASAFAAALVEKGIPGASRVLPVTFLVIVGTVLMYALTAAPVARRLKVVRPARTRPLLVGGDPWVIGLGTALRSAGLDVLMWAGVDEERERIREAGIELATGDMLATATNPRARLEGVTAVFLLTDDDDFNALASVVVQDNVEGPVYRVGPPHEGHGVVAPYTGGDILFGLRLVRPTLAARYEGGDRFVVEPADTTPGSGYDTLFVVRADGRLEPVTETQEVVPRAGDMVVRLGPAPPGSLEP